MLSRSTPLILLLALALLMPACQTLGGPSTDDEEEPERLPEPEAPAEPDAPPEEEEEEAPPGPRTVQGFRIQILTTQDKAAADERAAEAEAAWGTPVEVAWKAPYYRVRVGAFASRSAAQSTLGAVQQQYPDAFLVPDTVTIYPD